MKTISQREARRMRKEIDTLKRQRLMALNSYNRDYPGGTNIVTLTIAIESNIGGRLDALRMLGHALIAKTNRGADGNVEIRLFAVQP